MLIMIDVVSVVEDERQRLLDFRRQRYDECSPLVGVVVERNIFAVDKHLGSLPQIYVGLRQVLLMVVCTFVFALVLSVVVEEKCPSYYYPWFFVAAVDPDAIPPLLLLLHHLPRPRRGLVGQL